ncbi:hypothetical protein L3Q72_00975 [Vibrio sp. JC009]|uniref:hypothetical protein n=1 Tax=Vibrio sp. JC009 TaxID=2912314 RepID=UPI0023B10556|nr:hypothetical protein [Vibrio sp. JC009]WED22021.1 hypothetical protein L3Q72_00975 [Vibrio sp. JC009]
MSVKHLSGKLLATLTFTHGTVISSSKGYTVNQRRTEVAKTSKLIQEHCGKPRKGMSGLEFYKVTTEILKNELQDVSDLDWFEHPIATMSEPKKKVLAISQLSELEDEARADTYWRASLHPIDRFFMQIRRSINLFERPFTSANKDATWYGYAPYNPEMFQKLGDIYRVYYNYCEKHGKKGTPAMQLGLTKSVIDLEKIIYFSKYQ